MDADEFLRCYAAGERDFRKANFSRAYLRGAYLNEVNLRGAYLNEADLTEAYLTGAYLRGAYLNEVNLRGAYLYKVNLSYVNLRKANLTGADFCEADLTEANLTEANLSYAYFTVADLTEASLTEANLSYAYFTGASLSYASLTGANLSKTSFRGADFIGANFTGANFTGANLTGANFTGANFTGTNLTGANFTGANFTGANFTGANLTGADFTRTNLKETNLSEVQLLAAKLEEAILTAACIEDWNINSKTNLNGAICDYVYLKKDQQERRPHTGNFQPGEFTKLFQESLETVDLIFNKGVDWKAFAYSFTNTQVVNENTSLSIQSIENKGDGTVVIRVGVPPKANKEKIHDDFMQGYEFAQKALKSEYQARLEDQDKYINQLFNFINQLQQQIGEVPKLMAEAKKDFHFHAPVGSVSNEGNQANVGGVVRGDQKTIQHNYAPEVKQNLAEAHAEIEQLFKQIEQAYPTATPEEKQSALAITLQQEIKQNPTFKARLVNAFKEGGIETLKVLFAPIGIPIEMARGWIEAEAE
ncbi:MAG: pentapeptide repeat-containing protein [Symploca sp. SIO1B1]|nr:pentapeptide repeat-containing protein [Symploca sp. SIO1B1]